LSVITWKGFTDMPKSRSSRRVAELEAQLAAARQHSTNLEADIERRIDNEATARRMAAALCVCRVADGEHGPGCPQADDTPDLAYQPGHPLADREPLVPTIAEIQHERWPQYRSGYPSRVVDSLIGKVTR
jgi:hypothetical protein